MVQHYIYNYMYMYSFWYGSKDLETFPQIITAPKMCITIEEIQKLYFFK